MGLPLLADKEKPHNSRLFSDDQSIAAVNLSSLGEVVPLSSGVAHSLLFRKITPVRNKARRSNVNCY